MTPEQAQQRETLLLELYRNRRLAHEVIFKHRHSVRTPAFHHEIQDAFHGPHAQVVIEGFRAAAKSTVAEEGLVLGALFQEFRFGVILGPSFPRAKERLAAVANEFIVNDAINQLFGRMEGDTWGAGKIVLTNGVCIMALGVGMSMRGIRHLDARPDFALIDDFEDEESVRDVEARNQKMSWLGSTFMPALHKGPAGTLGYRVRMLGNRLDGDAVIVRVARDPAWLHLRFPIMEQAEDGVEIDGMEGAWRSLWAAQFSIPDIVAKRTEYQRLGLLHNWECEYMCEADNPEAHIFRDGDAKVVGRVRTWHAVYAAYDPARTTNSQSATTGIAVFSWIGQRLVVWRGDAQLWLPDQIIEDIFSVDGEYNPVEVGVEATGLEEFIMQPLRHKAVERRTHVPLRRLIPPRGKDSFIRGLQPFFKSGQVEFVDVSSEARGQLLSFPTGRKDFPNALAYALLMKPGLAVYDISSEHVQEQPIRIPAAPWYLVVNATGQYTAGALVQVIDQQVRVHVDWVREGPPGEVLRDIVQDARLDAGAVVRIVVPPVQPHDTVGLRLAVRAFQLDPRAGGAVSRGRAALRELLTRRRREAPLFVCGYAARWVLNALAGGYALAVDKRGQLAAEPVEGPYRVLMEGVESFCAQLGGLDAQEAPPRTLIGEDGRAYTTILPRAEPVAPAKDEWYNFGLVNSPNTIRVTRDGS